MVHLPSCLNQNSWAILLERELTEVFGTRPKDPSRARQIESLAEALDLVLRMECEPIAGVPSVPVLGASFQQLPGVQKVFDSRVLLALMTKDIPGLEAMAQEIPEDIRLTDQEKDLLRRLIEVRMEEVRSGGQ